ncbi:hypothetical protein F5Y08DRAFT_26312 [Xylaria arbuscula]|nr:hypothetical protein F5Y08DRAFT_26312 [Xylaria arbuscula]
MALIFFFFPPSVSFSGAQFRPGLGTPTSPTSLIHSLCLYLRISTSPPLQLGAYLTLPTESSRCPLPIRTPNKPTYVPT